MVTCWERADLLALFSDVNCIFVTFPCGVLGQVWYLIVSFPDLCHLSYFHWRAKTKSMFVLNFAFGYVYEISNKHGFL